VQNRTAEAAITVKAKPQNFGTRII
jgi:hypothetical protein